jgi:hypothetical protein
MPAQSKQQQKFMGMVHALKKGDMDPSDASPELKKAVDSMSSKAAKDYASTQHKGLPKKVKQEIVKRLKEYANKMGTNTMGGDDYTSSKKGGLRDYDGYDNVDYNRNIPNEFETELDERQLPTNWMSGRVSDYHTTLRGKKKNYSSGTNFRNKHSGHPDLEDDEVVSEAQAVSGGKVHKFITGKNITLKGKKHSDVHFELVSIDNKTQIVKLKVLAPKELFGHEINIDFRTLRRGPFIKTDTSKLESVDEYAQRLDFSYILDDEAILAGTPEPKDAIDRNIDEAMIRKAADIAHKLIPKDTWSRHFSFTDNNTKNKEFVKSMVRDLAQSLNRFYKTYDINVKIQENQDTNTNIDMVLGILSILKQIEDPENRKKVAVDMIRKFKEDNIDFDYKEFLNLMKEYSMGSYEYNK